MGSNPLSAQTVSALVFSQVKVNCLHQFLPHTVSLKVPKMQNRWYNLHPSPNPVDNRPLKVVKYWSNDPPHLNNSFSRISKLSGLTVTPPPLHPVAQDTLCKWDKALCEGTYVCNQAAGFNRCITKLQMDIQSNLKSLESELAKGKSSQKAEKALTEIQDLAAFNQNVSFLYGQGNATLGTHTICPNGKYHLVKERSVSGSP